MNGVRRFLGAGTGTPSPPSTSPVPPLAISTKPSWPPSSQPASPILLSQPGSPYESPKTTTAGLFLRKDKQKPLPQSPSTEISTRSRHSGSIASPISSPTRPLRTSPPKPQPASGSSLSSPVSGPSSPRVLKPGNADWKQSSRLLNTKDELLMSLLSSEAIVESREYVVLSAEEVEELKKEYQVLSSRVGAASKKLTLEMKIRDAAISLSKINAPHKKVSKQSEEQLEAANRKVDMVQKELWRVSERFNDIQRKLLEHRAGVLGLSVRSLETKVTTQSNGTTDYATSESGYSTPNRSTQMSPTLSNATSVSGSSSRSRFDGAHLFAGHADARIPGLPSRNSSTEVTTLEKKLKAATDALQAANKKQAEMVRELSLVRLEKEQIETTMGMELQSAEETIVALEKELPRLEGLDGQVQMLLKERQTWERDKIESTRQIEVLERRLEVLEEQSGEATSGRQEIVQLRRELEDATAALRAMIQAHGIFSRDPALVPMISGVRAHLEAVAVKADAHTRAQAEWESVKSKLEEDIRSGLEKREALYRDVEDIRREREEAKNEIRSLETRLRHQSDHLATVPSAAAPTSPIVEPSPDVGKMLAILRPIWSVLPSPETRAAKLGGSRNFRTGSPTFSPSSPKPQVSSLSEMDVRTLKTLYDSKLPHQASPNMSAFTIEGFASRVQALIADDKALIERLIRFAQAHDLLKKNAERAQKLAQESNIALETYQKQVRTLEERSRGSVSKVTALQDEVLQLQDSIDRIFAEKREVEMQAAEQAETCRQLTEANNTLSARTLTLAEEAAFAPERVRKQLEGQLAECKAALQVAQEEVDAMRTSEQSQRIALLDELNSLQTDNGNLRAQLRAAKK